MAQSRYAVRSTWDLLHRWRCIDKAKNTTLFTIIARSSPKPDRDQNSQRLRSKSGVLKNINVRHGAVSGNRVVEMAEKGGGGGGERWKAAIVNVTEMGANLDSLQKLLAKKAVFVDDDTFAKASLTADQARTIKVLLPPTPRLPSDPLIPPQHYPFEPIRRKVASFIHLIRRI